MYIVGEEELGIVFKTDTEGSVFLFNIISYLFVVLENSWEYSFLIFDVPELEHLYLEEFQGNWGQCIDVHYGSQALELNPHSAFFYLYEEQFRPEPGSACYLLPSAWGLRDSQKPSRV